MNLIKKQGGLLLFAILLIVLMYQFPKSVVENELTKNKVVETTSIEAAVNLLEGDNPMEGIFMLRDIVLKNPKNTQALYYLGDLSLQTGQYANAIKRFNQVLSVDSSDKRAYLQLGISYYGLEDYQKANSFFQTIKDLNDSTFTISNLGMNSVDEFNAIINPGNGAILAVSSIIKKPVIYNNNIEIRDMMKATLSADHRVMDGFIVAEFMNFFKNSLENTSIW